MSHLDESWTAQQLVEFLSVISSFPDEESAILGAVERASEALEAEVGAVVDAGRVLASVGFSRGEVGGVDLVTLARSGASKTELPGLGRCAVACAPLGEGMSGHLLLARAATEPFARNEIDLLRGMARVLALAISALRVPRRTTQRLLAFLSLVSSFADEAAAVQGAAEHSMRALDAAAAVVVNAGRVLACSGIERSAVPEAVLAPVTTGGAVAELPGIGACSLACVPFADGMSGCLVLARRRRFTQQEMTLINGMVRVLTLAMRSLRVLSAERSLRERSQAQVRENNSLVRTLTQRQALLERLFQIQRAIVQRADLDRVFGFVVGGAAHFLAADSVELWRMGELGCAPRMIASTPGAERAAPIEPARQAAIARLIAEPQGEQAGEPGDWAPDGFAWSLAAPVFENGHPVGVITAIARREPAGDADELATVLGAFAEHASLAMTDAVNFGTALHRAFHDMLTGLPNRALFTDRLEHASSRAVRGGRRPAVLFFDLDGFKRVNDSLGHAAGDELLVEVGRRLDSSLRPGDTAARFGGDEFAILLEDVDGVDGAVEIAERVMADLHEPFEVQGKPVTVAVSLGIATLREVGEDLMRNADLAMYQAKARGRDKYEVFESAMHATLVERMRLEADLERAVEREEFEVVYQPIVDLRDGAVVAVEALARWRHPERGLLEPAAFIAAAEDTGAIRAMGRHVLARACEEAVRWQTMFPASPPLAIAVNLSVNQLQHQELLGEVSDALARSGLEPSSLILEITETVLMHEQERGMLGQLKALGARIAVDDFGTGYSSLQYLQGLPIDILKIDRSFVSSINTPGDLTLAQAVIDIGEGLDLCVVAEGIEQQDQVAKLIARGCHLGQGFLFARPQRPHELDMVLRRQAVRGWRGRTPSDPASGMSAHPRAV